jgi:hypothetical protein
VALGLGVMTPDLAHLCYRITWFAEVMRAVFGAGTALAFAGGEPRLLLLKDSVNTVERHPQRVRVTGPRSTRPAIRIGTRMGDA